jgi:hypothetical protein
MSTAPSNFKAMATTFQRRFFRLHATSGKDRYLTKWSRVLRDNATDLVRDSGLPENAGAWLLKPLDSTFNRVCRGGLEPAKRTQLIKACAASMRPILSSFEIHRDERTKVNGIFVIPMPARHVYDIDIPISKPEDVDRMAIVNAIYDNVLKSSKGESRRAFFQRAHKCFFFTTFLGLIDKRKEIVEKY